MNSFLILGSVFTPISIVVILLSFNPQRALGLVNDNANNKSKPKTFSSEGLSQSPKSIVSVWNNVIDVDHLAPLLDDESRRIGLGHQVFCRSSLATPQSNDRSSSSSNNNIIEQTLDSILTELNDDAKYVEYWTRREWLSIHAHADVDEYRAKQEQKSGETIQSGFRYPRNGHVLYLQVGSKVRGPTCIFPDRRSGGDLLRKTSTIQSTKNSAVVNASNENNDGDEPSPVATISDHDDVDVELVTVPAVPGRLLRFQGDSLHAVPRPTDFWLLKFVMGSPTFEPEQEWGRSVILFNTWSDEPPSGLPIDKENDDANSSIDSTSTRSGEQHDGTTTATTTATTIPHLNCKEKHEWACAYPLSPSPAPTAELLPQEEQNGSTNDQTNDQQQQQQLPLSTKIWLLGDYRRRDFKMQTVKLEAPETLREALYQETDVVSTKLTIPS